MARSVNTKITELFNIKIPIISAPMAYATTPALVAEVIKGGGLGFLGAGAEPAPKIAQAIDEARALLSPELQRVVGMGFVGWVLDKLNTDADPRFQAALDKAPSAIFLAYGPDLNKYVTQVRAFDASSGRKTFVFVTVNTVQEAVRAANDWKADVLVAQGAEAGGRGSVYSPPTAQFLKDVLAALPGGPPVVAAGGITTGQQIAAQLAAGAAGVVLGTRLLFTEECMYSDEMKDVLVRAGPDTTARSTAYDLAFPPGVWPDGIQARCVNNAIVTEFASGASPEERKANIAKGDRDHLIVYAGVGVADTSEIKKTADVMKTLHEETVAALEKSAPHLLG
ncbi:uncharacterized protein C8Q71DRAFT_727517 [Rhodofomes roseus]|nr:uncharacterized protein C8Q71DRAFT_727517 [Rhodofomes roseus]KAH9830262.1 hypothetical protein C8Q71DRAFT_727517 [Rhodofomes roseus]